MKNIKIAFFDIDGTILRFGHKELTPNTLKALNSLKEKGIILCIATGRTPLYLPKFKDLFDCYITFNGSYCFNKKEDIFSNPINQNEINTIINNINKINKSFCLASKDQIICNGKDKEMVDFFLDNNVPLIISDEYDKVTKDDIYQIMASVKENEYDDVLKNTKHVKISSWQGKSVDIIPNNGGKGVAVDKILEYYHLTKDEAIAFGDGENDIEMLKAVGLGVAMGNASDELKNIASDICDSADNDGVYHYCLNKGLI